MSNWMTTFTGRKFYPAEPNPADVDILDIAHALSNICRFGGHCMSFYSVAQHSVTVSRNCVNSKWGLMHDAAEAYVGDIIRPIKSTDNRVIENRILQVIASKFGLCWPVPYDVKRADDETLWAEARCLFTPGADLELPESTVVIGRPLPSCDAEVEFLNRFYELL